MKHSIKTGMLKPGLLITNSLHSMPILLVLSSDSARTKYIHLNSKQGFVIQDVNTSYFSTWLYNRVIVDKTVYVYE